MKIDVELAQRLVRSQFPQWADLPVRAVEHGGWDNRTFHLGETMSLRLPSAAAYASKVEKEQEWLPRLAPRLPLPIPTPIAQGKAGDGYPWPWSIYGWIDGETAKAGRIDDRARLASDLAGFLRTLHGLRDADAPAPGAHNFHRGGDLSVYDGETRRALGVLAGEPYAEQAEALWDAGLAATWKGRPGWLHGDVDPRNLIVRDGRLVGVIDFGGSAVGDPSCDLTIAWTFFTGESRAAFRDAIGADDATWRRARAWATWKALITIARLEGTDASMIDHSRRALDAVLADIDGPGRSE